MSTNLSRFGYISFWDTDTQAANVVATSPVFEIQRYASETGNLHVEVDSALTATPGTVHLEGRFSPDHGWADLATRDFSDLVAIGGQKGLSTVDVPLAPYVRIRLSGNTGILPATTKLNVRLEF